MPSGKLGGKIEQVGAKASTLEVKKYQPAHHSPAQGKGGGLVMGLHILNSYKFIKNTQSNPYQKGPIYIMKNSYEAVFKNQQTNN